MKKAFLLSILSLAAAVASAQSNIAVFVAAANTSNTGGRIIILDPGTAAQTTPVSTFFIDSTSANALRFSGSATSTAYLSNNADRTLVTFTGANTATATGNSNTVLLRGVGTINSTGTYALATTYTGVSGSQTRSATTVNNTDYFIADGGGFYTNGATSPSPTGNYRAVKTFGSTVYIGQASTATAPVGIISAPSGGTVTPLPGLPNGTASSQDFYLIQSGSNGSTYDVLYVNSATSNTAGTIAKYSLVSGTWVANGTYSTTFGGFGLYAVQSGTGANLFVTTGQGALSNNSLIKLFDAAGYNTAMNITTANNVTLFTASGNNILKGVAMAPSATPVPLGLTSFVVRQETSSVAAEWTTAKEQGVSHFLLERSADGKNYASVATVSSANRAGTQHYSAYDNQPLPGRSYYRLASVDMDGTVSYSAATSIFFRSRGTSVGLHVAPNPVEQTFSVVHAAASEGARVNIIDMNGRTVLTRALPVGGTVTNFEDVQLPVGTYIATFESNGQKETTVFVK